MQNPSSNRGPPPPLKKEFQDSRQSLQERLHTLLTRISKTTEILRTWPSEDHHTQTTTLLTQALHKVVEGIQQVEEKVNGSCDEEAAQTQPPTTAGEVMTLQAKLRQTAIPLDLLDMMDYGNDIDTSTRKKAGMTEDTHTLLQPSHFTGLNPDCFARGLLRESLRQIGNMNRRKAALKMLAVSIQNGMNAREDMISPPSPKRMKIE